jgi:hypothetical protein
VVKGEGQAIGLDFGLWGVGRRPKLPAFWTATQHSQQRLSCELSIASSLAKCPVRRHGLYLLIRLIVSQLHHGAGFLSKYAVLTAESRPSMRRS